MFRHRTLPALLLALVVALPITDEWPTITVVALSSGTRSTAQTQPQTPSVNRTDSAPQITPGSTVFIVPASDGFHWYLAKALKKKKVPLVLVGDRGDAKYEISQVINSERRALSDKEKAAGAGVSVLLGVLSILSGNSVRSGADTEPQQAVENVQTILSLRDRTTDAVLYEHTLRTPLSFFAATPAQAAAEDYANALKKQIVGRKPK